LAARTATSTAATEARNDDEKITGGRIDKRWRDGDATIE
jgi:hypothetical protein